VHENAVCVGPSSIAQVSCRTGLADAGVRRDVTRKLPYSNPVAS
jgi:hypothetical protein